MRRFIPLISASLGCWFLTALLAGQNTPGARLQNPQLENKAPVVRPAPFPPQLEVRVPFEPTSFPNGQHVYLAYELHLTNYLPLPLSLSRIAVLNANTKAAPPIAIFEGEQLEKMLQPLGGAPPGPKERLVVTGGHTTIVYMWIEFDRDASIPGSGCWPRSQDSLAHSLWFLL